MERHHTMETFQNERGEGAVYVHLYTLTKKGLCVKITSLQSVVRCVSFTFSQLIHVQLDFISILPEFVLTCIHLALWICNYQGHGLTSQRLLLSSIATYIMPSLR